MIEFKIEKIYTLSYIKFVKIRLSLLVIVLAQKN